MGFKKTEDKEEIEQTTTVNEEIKEISTNLPIINSNLTLVNRIANSTKSPKKQVTADLQNVFIHLRDMLMETGEVVIPGLGKLSIKYTSEKKYPTKLRGMDKTYVVKPHHKIIWKTTSSLTLSEAYLADIAETKKSEEAIF